MVFLVIFEIGYITIRDTRRCVIAHGCPVFPWIKGREAVPNPPGGGLQRTNLRVKNVSKIKLQGFVKDRQEWRKFGDAL